MFTRLYKSSSFVQNLIIFFAVIALWFPRFYEPPAMPADCQQPLFNFCFGWIAQFPYLSMGIALLLLFFGAFFVQQSLHFDRLRMSGRNFPMILFVVLSAMPYMAYFSPVTLVIGLLAVALLFIFQIPETAENDHLIFFAALFFGIAALFYLPALVLMALFITIFFQGNFNVKKIWIALLGFLFPVIWAVSLLYLTSNLDVVTGQWEQYYSTGTLVELSLPQPALDMFAFVVAAFFVLFYILMIVRILSKYSERTAMTRRRIAVSVFLAFWLLLSAVLSYNFYEHLSLLSIPMVVLISYYYGEDAEVEWLDYVFLGGFIMLVIHSFLQI
jgi:hypothetical protein